MSTPTAPLRAAAVWSGVAVRLVIFLLLDYCTAEFAGCGGFVKLSPELAGALSAPIDFTQISVNLFTLEGIRKDSVSCAPHGYYFIPIYDRGSYYLSVDGPQGWNFDTKRHRVDIEDNKCNNDEDLDYVITGFSLSGWIVGEAGPRCPGSPETGPVVGRTGGPAGVIVQVSKQDPHNGDAFEPRTTMTGEGGLYVFPKMLPGTYVLTASHPTWSLTPSQITTVIQDTSAEVKDDFRVSGYDVRARVVSSVGEDPISGVEFSLHTFSDESEHGKGALFAKARSDDRGRVVFTNIPRGCFVLVPSFAQQATFFEFQPTHLQIEVGHGSVVIDNPFRVVGFTVYGRVMQENGHPIEQVAILVGSEVRATTDADGFYKIEKLSAGTFDIVAKKDHTYFNNLLGYHVDANDPALPDITVSGYDVCGKVIFSHVPHSIKLPSQREIRATNLNFDVVFLSEPIDASGTYSYCFRMPTLETPFTIFPVLSKEERLRGLILKEESRIISISNSPVLNVDFVQFIPSLSGQVSCIEPPCSSVVVTLSHQEDQVTATASEDGSFHFNEIFPGEYKLSVSETGSSIKTWCWDERTKTILVGRSNVNNVKFVHTGYAFNVLSVVNDATISLAHDKGVSHRTISKGTNSYCFEYSGTYTIRSEGCYQLERESYIFTTDAKLDPQTGISIVSDSPSLFFNPIASLVKGEVSLTEKRDVDVFVNITSFFGKDTTTQTIQAFPSKEKGRELIYEYEFWNKKNTKELLVVPFLSSPDMLIYPPEARVTIQKEFDCDVRIPSFSVRPGVYVGGVVTPALAGVSVIITEKKLNTVIVALTTDSNGTYRSGPLYDNIDYEVSVSKVGYHIEIDPENPFNFFAKKLASIFVSIKDAANQTPLEGVLVSLSGLSYRNNNLTSSEGTIEFGSLSPGSYFLRPMLKEYSFEPAQMSLVIQEGTHEVVSVSAVRMEYSCYGKVTSLNNQPLSRVIVEAFSSDDHEETQTDGNGEFRLRGLSPGSEYQVSLKGTHDAKNGKSTLRSSVPESVKVEMGKEDVFGVNFIAFTPSNLVSVRVAVEAQDVYLPSLKLELLQTMGSGLVAFKDSAVSPVRSVEFAGVPLGSYVLKLSSNLPRSQYRFSDVKEQLTLKDGDVVVDVAMRFRVVTEDDFTESTVLPFPFLFVLIGVVYCLYNYKKVSAFVQNPRSFFEEKKWEPQAFLPEKFRTQLDRKGKKKDIKKD